MNEPKWLQEYRDGAEKHFQELSPEKSQYTTLKINFDEIINCRNVKADIPDKISAFMKDKSKIMIVQLNSEIIHTNVPRDLHDRGFILESFQDALSNHIDLVKEFFDKKVTNPGESKLIAMNCAYFNSGIFVHVPKNMEISLPVYHILMVTGDSKVISKTMLSCEEGSRVLFVEEDYSSAKNAFHDAVIEIYAKESSEASFVNMQNFDHNVTSITNKKALVERDAKVNWMIGRLGSSTNKTKRDTMLVGEGASVSDTEIFLGNRNQHFDITSNIHHKVPNTKGNVLVKGVLRDSARSVSQGMIKIDKNAQKTDSFLAEHTMLLDPEARSDAIPGLEIEANDVRATHSASVSQIDEEQVFYLKCRGVDEDEAKKLIVLGFLNSALEKISVKEVSNQFRLLVEEKWVEQ
jgi:Fe-S cluster assembly protein SufB/Fe-S cluster assembly protein SufD